MKKISNEHFKDVLLNNIMDNLFIEEGCVDATELKNIINNEIQNTIEYFEILEED